MPLTVSEPLNPDKWSRSEQQSVYDALYILLGISLIVPADMTDVELSNALHVVLIEIESRPLAVTIPSKSIEFEGDTIVMDI